MEDSQEQQPISEQMKLRKLISSEGLDQLMEVVGVKGWIALYTCFALILITFLWSIFGSIPVKVTGYGLSMTQEGAHIIIAQVQGTIAKIYVTPGQQIQKNQVIAVLENPTLSLDIQLKREEIALKQNDLCLLISQVETEDSARKEALMKELEAAEAAKKKTEASLEFLKRDLEAKRRLEQKGIVPITQVEEARRRLADAEILIESSQANIKLIQSQQIQEYRKGEISAKETEIIELKAGLDRLLLQDEYLEIRSDRAGKILEVVVSVGDLLKPGSELASLEVPIQKGEHLIFYAVFGAQYGDLLDVDLPVQIEVSGVDPKLYGFLLGKTKFVSPYPVTTEDLVSDVRNAEIVNYIKGTNKVVYSAMITLEVDPKTVSGYRWSTQNGPPWELSSGTIGKAQTIVQRKPPIVYILPLDFSPILYHALSGEN